MSFVAQAKPRGNPGQPLIALIDILFLLLIFFMWISEVREDERQIQVTLPAATTGDPLTSVTPLNIEVRADGGLYLNRTPHTAESLAATLSSLARRFPHEVVYIRADENASYGLFKSVADMVREAGFSDIGLPVRPGQPPRLE
ncbi:MAG: biopolymer transporter ExbD [Phycisphaeraceae bacterium]|nr:biopolymer transporter ExbD [Phycisphaeraceae bacterium]